MPEQGGCGIVRSRRITRRAFLSIVLRTFPPPCEGGGRGGRPGETNYKVRGRASSDRLAVLPNDVSIDRQTHARCRRCASSPPLAPPSQGGEIDRYAPRLTPLTRPSGTLSPLGRGELRTRAWRPLIFLTAVLAPVAASASEVKRPPEPPAARVDDKTPRIIADVVLQGGTLIDGTGGAARLADVALKGDRIVAVGSFECDPKAKIVDVSSLCVAPGFIDLHNHSDSEITQPRLRLNANYLTQGVTTIVTGNCGKGVLDVAKYLATIDGQGAGTNVVHLVPHGTLRAAVLGNADRPPSASELDRMKRLLEAGLEAARGDFRRG